MRSVKAKAVGLLRAAYVKRGSTGYTRCHVCGGVLPHKGQSRKFERGGHREDCVILKLEKK